MKEKIIALYKKHSETLILRLLAAWCFAAIFLGLYASGSYLRLQGYAKVSFSLTAGTLIFAFVLFTVLSLVFRKLKTDLVLLPVFFGLYSFIGALIADDWYTIFVFAALWVLLCFYYSEKRYLAIKIDLSPFLTLFYILFAAVLCVCLVGGVGVLRYRTFSAPNYDFGIFCDMFRNMKEHFVPVTTCERDGYLSHFAVHLSPIFYLLLPVYFVFPSGATLQFCQALVLASGAAPVYFLAKKYGFNNLRTVLLCGIFSLSPVLASGTNYDLHENCFLVPLLLWMFYFFEKEKYLPFAVFAGLTLLVKEDAAVYVVMFALFMIFDRKKIRPGVITAVCAVVYFMGAVVFLTLKGGGVMAGRYSNYIVANGGLAEMVKNVLADPAFVFTQLFKDKTGGFGEKMLFILQMTVPLVFLPFTAKKPTRLILLFPMLLFNLMTLYPYQYNIGYQYAFGSFTFLFYLSIINLSEKKQVTVTALTNAAAVITAMCFIFVMLPRTLHYMSLYSEGKEQFAAMEELLSEIPEDKSVVCSTFLLPHLVNREEVYEIEYHDTDKGGYADYVILDLRYKVAEFEEQYKKLGYKVTDTLTVDGKQLITVMQRDAIG